ncbi:MAG: biotin--[acetyl-CoA-carboxylase] ligase [Lachnospiraceae bacterium]|nr:biotin--[acetyl-CoA-carboxylase] ligase [Lachnospiraceae bacterium]
MNKDLTDLLSKNEFVSGQQIADTLGVSRNAVWKAVEKIRREGFDIEAVTGRGYRLKSNEDAFGEISIQSFLKTKWLGRDLTFFEETGSTNDEIKRKAEQGAAQGLVAVADRQTKGKGRRGRTWETPGGENIAMSCLLRPSFSPDIAPMLTMVMAISALQGIEEITGLEPFIKWPNDIVINGKKCVGILTEMSAEPDYIHYVVTGTGVNVNTESFPDEIREMATSLYLEGGRKYSRSKLTAAIINAFEKNYELFEERGDLGAFSKLYNSRCVNAGKRVCVMDPKGSFEGLAKGIDDRGELLVTKDDGEETAVYAGEVSVRGMYGYT